jgi:hypothetical protein
VHATHPTRYHRRISQPDWPADIDRLFSASITAEYSSLTRSGAPVTVPTTPYRGSHGTLDLSTGLTYPTKAERARRNPRVSLLFADPLGEGMEHAPVALVQGTPQSGIRICRRTPTGTFESRPSSCLTPPRASRRSS